MPSHILPLNADGTCPDGFEKQGTQCVKKSHVIKQSEVQSLVFDKSKFSRAQAVNWAKDHDFIADKVDETSTTYRLRQKDPSLFQDDSFSTIQIAPGIKSVIGKPIGTVEARKSKAFLTEAGIHIHNLDRINRTTLTDGIHNHLFVLSDGTHVVTRDDGVHEHALESSSADLIRKLQGGHSHIVILPDGSQVETEEDGFHTHQLQVSSTAFDGIHIHAMVLPDGRRVRSLWPGEFWERFGSGILKSIPAIPIHHMITKQAVRFVTLGTGTLDSDRKESALLVLGDRNFLIDAGPNINEGDVAKFTNTLDTVFLTDPTGLESAKRIAEVFKAGVVVPEGEEEIETSSRDLKIFPRAINKSVGRFGYLIETKSGNVAYAPRFLKFPKWINNVDLAFIDGAAYRNNIQPAGLGAGHLAVLSAITKLQEQQIAQIVVTNIGADTSTALKDGDTVEGVTFAKDGQEFNPAIGNGLQIRKQSNVTHDELQELITEEQEETHGEELPMDIKLALAAVGIIADEEPVIKKSEMFSNIRILKRDDDKRIVYGVVLEPETIDAHGDIMNAEEIEKAAHFFMARSRVIGLQHEGVADATVVESFIAPDEFVMGTQVVRKGSWVLASHISDHDQWNAVKVGQFGSYSVGGWALKQPLI